MQRKRHVWFLLSAVVTYVRPSSVKASPFTTSDLLMLMTGYFRTVPSERISFHREPVSFVGAVNHPIRPRAARSHPYSTMKRDENSDLAMTAPIIFPARSKWRTPPLPGGVESMAAMGFASSGPAVQIDPSAATAIQLGE